MVSSMSVTSSSATKTISGLAVVTKITSGMVDMCSHWLSYIPGRSTQRIVSLSSCSLMDFTRDWRV